MFRAHPSVSKRDTLAEIVIDSSVSHESFIPSNCGPFIGPSASHQHSHAQHDTVRATHTSVSIHTHNGVTPTSTRRAGGPARSTVYACDVNSSRRHARQLS